jgi:opacity protein-like surface antigen
MRKTIALLALCVCSLVVCAQKSTEKPAPAVSRNMGLEVSGGYSIALGMYASSDQQNKKSGYATGGWLVQLTFDWLGKKDFGLALQYTYQRNPMENAANEVYPNGHESLASGAWSNHYLLAGPVFMKTISRIHLDAKVLGGLIVSSGINWDTPNASDTAHPVQNIATGFGYQISAGVGYAVSPKVSFKFNLTLLGGWPGKNKQYGAQLIGYEDYTDPVTGIKYLKPYYSAPMEYEIKKVVTTLNPSIGLVYRF